MRRRLHEFVEGGEIRKGGEETGRYHGFGKFPKARDIEGAFTFGVGKVEIKNDRVRLTKPDALEIGQLEIDNLNELASEYGPAFQKLVEREIEFSAGHEAGEVRYGCAVATRQLRRGMDILGDKADSQRESQANLYSAVKYHESDGSVDELLEGIAAHVWYNGIHGRGHGRYLCCCREDAGKYAMEQEGLTWLKTQDAWAGKPEALEKVLDRVVEIEREHKKNG